MKALSAILVAGALAAAPPPPPPTWAQLQAAYLTPQNASCLKDTSAFGLGAGRWVAPQWGWEATYLQARLENKVASWKATEQHLTLSGLFRPWGPAGDWMPFLRAGLGASRLESPLSLGGSTSTRLNLTAGAGAQAALSERLFASLELRFVDIQSSTRRQEVEALAGLGWRWSD